MKQQPNQQESPADARVTRDSQAPGNKSEPSQKPHPRTKHHVDRQDRPTPKTLA